MEAIEISAPTLEAAKKQAAEKLGVEVGALTVTVLEETKGLFGKGTVRIRAEAGNGAPVAETKPKRGAKAKKAEEPAPEDSAPAEPAAEETEAKPAKRGRGKAKAEPKSEAETPPSGEEEAEKAAITATEQDAKALLGLLQDVLKAANLDVKVSISGMTGRYVNLTLDGKDTGHLVGKQGEVLNALQYLVNIIANQQIGNGVRATLDGNDYRTRREAALTKLATTIAEQVVKRGEEAVLDALPAFERRIVHKALSDMANVTTYSEGEEPNRRVVIAPAE